MFYYCFYGHLFETNVELITRLSKVDKLEGKVPIGRIIFCEFFEHENYILLKQLGRSLYRVEGGYIIDKKICKFFISDVKSEILVFGNPQELERTTIYLLGEVLALFFRLNGVFFLHAAMVSQNEFTFVLCGDSGNGKSTLAYEFYSRGWNLLCDDHSAVFFENNEFLGVECFPYIKVFCAEHKNNMDLSLCFEIPDTEKGLYAILNRGEKDRFKKYSISHIIFLSLLNTEGTIQSIKSINQKETLTLLLKSCYTNLKSNGDIYLLQKDLDSISIINKMSKNIPAYQLVYSNAKPCDIVDKITSHIINKKA